MAVKPVAEYLAQYRISIDTTVKARYPYVPFNDKKSIKELETMLKEIRPNYPEYDNTTLYKDNFATTWVHVCEASLDKGIAPVNYVVQPLPMHNITERDEEHILCEMNHDMTETFCLIECH